MGNIRYVDFSLLTGLKDVKAPIEDSGSAKILQAVTKATRITSNTGPNLPNLREAMYLTLKWTSIQTAGGFPRL